MKKILIALGCVVLILVGGVFWMVNRGYSVSTGVCLATENGGYLIALEHEPVSMHIRTGNYEIFDGLQTGDKLLILHDGIEETYPAQTGVYFLLKTGSDGELNANMLASLEELGWNIKPDA